jgi:hypothetical protein
MKTLLILITLTATTQAQLSFLGGGGPDGVCRFENGTLQCYPQQQSVPEPSSPLVMLVAAGLALIGRRHREGCIRERRVDLRTVRFP